MHLKELYRYNYVTVCVLHLFMPKFLENKYGFLPGTNQDKNKQKIKFKKSSNKVKSYLLDIVTFFN